MKWETNVTSPCLSSTGAIPDRSCIRPTAAVRQAVGQAQETLLPGFQKLLAKSRRGRAMDMQKSETASTYPVTCTGRFLLVQHPSIYLFILIFLLGTPHRLCPTTLRLGL